MPNPEHLRFLKRGVERWNAWRDQHEKITPDLIGADLTSTNLRGANLLRAELRSAELRGADLRKAHFFEAELAWADLREADLAGAALPGADLRGADLRGANLHGADLRGANFTEADLRGANLIEANLRGTNLHGANLTRADFRRAYLRESNLVDTNLTGADVSQIYLFSTVFGNTTLTDAQGLATCNHGGPSILDHHTIVKSWPLPVAFLRGCGLPDALIDYLPSLLNQPFQFYSCFISYASKDHAFAECLHADLQNKGVRCWFAPEDMKIGDRLRPRIDGPVKRKL
jgi:uncharacterized protein YjbI with pentapeptide repeats